MGLIVLLFSSSERLLQTMSSIMHFSHSRWRKKKSVCVCARTVDTHMYFTKRCNMPDKACHCSYDPLFMLVMFCCLTLLSGSAASDSAGFRDSPLISSPPLNTQTFKED